MVRKSISIDSEAYNRLVKAKQGSESFSDLIKRVVIPPVDVEAWLGKTSKDPFSDRFVRAVEDHVKGRQSRSRPSRRRAR